MMPSFDLSKKKIFLISSIVVLCVAFIVFIQPLFVEVRELSHEVKSLDKEMAKVRSAVDMGSKIDKARHLLSRDEVSVAINEVINVGTKFNINFLSTSPQPIEHRDSSKYPVLPIDIEIQSTYQDIGKFLGALDNLSKSVATIKTFTIDRDADLLPKVRMDLVIEMYLKEGEGG